MGQVHSQVRAGAPFNVSPRRLNVWEFQCCLNEGDQTCASQSAQPISSAVLLSCSAPPSNGSTSSGSNSALIAGRPDGRPLTFVQDPETQELLLQLPFRSSLTFKFGISVAGAAAGSRLIFAHAGSAAELQQVITHRCTELWTELRTWPEELPHTDSFNFVFVWDAADVDQQAQSQSQSQSHSQSLPVPLPRSTLGVGQPLHFAFFFDDGSSIQHPDAGGAVWISERLATNELALLDDKIPLSPGGEQDYSEAYTPFTPAPPAAYNSAPPLPFSALAPFTRADPKSAPPTTTGATIGATGGATSGGATTGSTGANTGSTGANTGSTGANTGTTSTSGDLPYGVPLDQQDIAKLQAPRPSADNFFQAEDGPQFRSSIANMERRVPELKARVKQLLKRGLMSRDRLQALIEADAWLASGIQEAARRECYSLRPVADWFSRNSEGGLSAIQRQRKVSLNEITTRIVEPLQQFYEHDIKCFEQRKREFEEESSQFYSWTSRYLSARKEVRRSKSAESADSKFASKKRAFDAARFDYFSYLNDLTSGLKQQILLQLFALATQSLTDSHIALGSELANRTQPRVDAIVEDIKKAAREWEKFRLEKLQYRRSQLESDQETGGRSVGTSGTSAPQQQQPVTDRPASPELPTPLPPTHTCNYKEGLLWASSRPGGLQDVQLTNKQSLQNLKWHKYWVVLDGTSLREYSNWKQSIDLHNEPINLLLASAREARNSDRRFCFEIVTPNYKRVYQATSEDDMRSWIAAIHKSVSTFIESSEDPHCTAVGKHNHQTPVGSPQHHHPQPQPLQSQSQQQPQQHSQQQQQSQSQQQPQQQQSTIIHVRSQAASPSHQDLEISKRGGASKSTQSSSSSESGSRTNGERLESITRKLSLKSERPRVPPIVTSMVSGNQSSSITPKLMSPQKHHHHHQPQILEGVHHHHHHPQSGGPNTPQFTPLKSSPFDELLFKVHTIPSNRCCAECGTTKSVEWVSINLLMVLCIDCSGAHRSLGAHISKVRSLTLDTGAFTPSLQEALLSVSNESMNSIWEAQLPPDRKPGPDASSQARIKFVTEKYIEKQYIRELEKPNAALRRAISEQNISKMCEALASRANPNGVSDDDEPMLILALRSTPRGSPSFPTAEVLIKNGAIVPPVNQYSGLSPAALDYLRRKEVQPLTANSRDSSSGAGFEAGKQRKYHHHHHHHQQIQISINDITIDSLTDCISCIYALMA